MMGHWRAFALDLHLGDDLREGVAYLSSTDTKEGVRMRFAGEIVWLRLIQNFQRKLARNSEAAGRRIRVTKPESSAWRGLRSLSGLPTKNHSS